MTTRLRTCGVFASLILVFLVGLSPQSLKGQNRERRSQDRQEMEQRFRRQMTRLIQDRLGIDDAQSEQLSQVIRGFEERRRELGRAERAVRERVESLVADDARDGREAEQLLARMIELRQEESRLYAEEQAALLEVLTPMQVLELQALRADMGRRIRSLRGGDGRRRGRDRGGPGAAAWSGASWSGGVSRP